MFKSLTGYPVKSDATITTDFVVNYDTKTLLVRPKLTAVQHLLAIIGALGMILGGQTFSAESTGRMAALTTALAQNSDEVISLEEKRVLRQRGGALKELARGKRGAAPPHPPIST